jgi:hypothetical protein
MTERKFHGIYAFVTAFTSSSSPLNENKSRGKNCFASGKQYQTHICETINNTEINGIQCAAKEVDGAKAGADINLTSHSNIGIETKKAGAFEGGCIKMTYNAVDKRMEITKKGIHQSILGATVLYNGQNLPWYEGKKTLDDWKKMNAVFEKDVYIDASDNAVSEYYQKGGVNYIQIEKKGLYHTGNDPLTLGVPYFSCPETRLRIRGSKHKNAQGIYTDIYADLNYNHKKLVASPFSLDENDNGILPPAIKKKEAAK